MLLTRFRPEFSDGVVDLIPIRLFPPEKEMGFGHVYDYIIAPCGQRREAGRVSLRMGESPCVYYFAISATTWTRPGGGITTRPGLRPAGPAHLPWRQILGWLSPPT